MNYRRSSSNNIISGVCGGLENYTGLDAIFWRILFLLFIGTGSVGIYFLIWILSSED
jgi:phage shock protein PspC (stress-responsive transcriptional regulator)